MILFILPAIKAQINTTLSSENLSVTSQNPTCNTNVISLSSSHNLIYSGPNEAYTVKKELHKVGFGMVVESNFIGAGNNPIPFNVSTNVQGNGTFGLGLYPNPLITHSTIALQVATDLTMNLKVYDLNGKLIMDIFNYKILPTGNHQVILSRELFPASGVYFLKAQGGTSQITHKIIVM